MKYLLTWLLSLMVAAALALSGCGGGGTDDSTPTDLSALAANAQLTASYDQDTRVARLSWNDTLPEGTLYLVQSQSSDGTFATLDTVAGAGGSSERLNWTGPITQTTTFQVQAQPASGSAVTLQTEQKQSSVQVIVPSVSPVIALNMAEPVSGEVELSIEDQTQFSSVSWYVDTRLIGQGAASPGNPINWNTSSETNESHLVIARIETSTDSYTDVRRTVQVSNLNLALTASVRGTSGTIYVDVSTSSPNGISQVEASFDGTPMPSLSEPNARCNRCSSNNIYRFTVDAASAGSGEHTMSITSVDRQNNRKTITVAVPVDNKPVLSLSTPMDGALVYGSLLVSGSVTSDKSGEVTTTASLGELQFMNTTASSFTGSLDLSGLPAKTYTLTVSSRDSSGATTVVQRNVTVTSSEAYSPILDMGVDGRLLAADGAQLLYRNGAESYRLRNTQTGTEVSLTGANTVAGATDWQVSAGHVFVQGTDSDCVDTCIYHWRKDGSRRNLTLVNPYSKTSNEGDGYSRDLNPVVRGNYVIWFNWSGTNDDHYTVYNRSRNSFTKIDMPAGVNYLGNNDFDATVTGGTLRFFYWAQTGGSGNSSSFDVYRWDANSKTSTQLSTVNAANIYPQTDGVDVIWLQSPVGAYNRISTLVSQPIAGGANAILATNATSLMAADGVVSWLEGSSLKARYAGEVRTLSSLKPVANLYGTSAGHVVFADQSKLYSWNASSNTTVLRLDITPGQVITNGGYLYFVLGNGQMVYRVSL
jgi:hypothetical protein